VGIAASDQTAAVTRAGVVHPYERRLAVDPSMLGAPGWVAS
jgi:hypothetical protein